MLFNRKGLPCLSKKFGEELLLRRCRGPDAGGLVSSFVLVLVLVLAMERTVLSFADVDLDPESDSSF